MRRAVLPLLLLLAAAPVAAQPSDPIGALIDHRDEEPDDPEAEKPLPLPPLPPPETPRPAPYVAPAPAPPPPRPQLAAPVHIEETGKTPDAPPSVQDLAYDSRLRSSYASAQRFQGPLDGGWTLAAKDAEDLYALQLVDRSDRLEGVWRDLRRKGALDGSGLVDDIQRSGAVVTLRFATAGGARVAATLRGTYDGAWTGELTEGGHTRPVVLRRQRP